MVETSVLTMLIRLEYEKNHDYRNEVKELQQQRDHCQKVLHKWEMQG